MKAGEFSFDLLPSSQFVTSLCPGEPLPPPASATCVVLEGECLDTLLSLNAGCTADGFVISRFLLVPAASHSELERAGRLLGSEGGVFSLFASAVICVGD